MFKNNRPFNLKKNSITKPLMYLIIQHLSINGDPQTVSLSFTLCRTLGGPEKARYFYSLFI